MKKWVIAITVETDAPREVVEEIAEQMRWQLDSLNDGTLEMEEGKDPVNHDYICKEVEVRE